MTTTTAAAPIAEDRDARRGVWGHGLAATAAAALTTTLLPAAAVSAGVTFEDRTGAGIPLLGFAQLTALFSLLGVALAAALVVPTVAARLASRRESSIPRLPVRPT